MDVHKCFILQFLFSGPCILKVCQFVTAPHSPPPKRINKVKRSSLFNRTLIHFPQDSALWVTDYIDTQQPFLLLTKAKLLRFNIQGLNHFQMVI